ncbi:MAG: BolA/IbaG family iron-sulfur metabolism protein, partial [Microcystaceae cyanobacterium]
MVSLSEVESMIVSQIPDARVMVQDLGGGDHLDAIVISEAFKGQNLIKQHQMVYAALTEHMASEAIHALA